MNQNNCIPLEALERYAKYFNKQEGRRYPCSNQIVLCGVITKDRNKAIDFMNKKGATIKRLTHNSIEWELGNERWLWRTWNESCRGYRFYKLIIDESVDKSLFDYIILPCCSIYCCSFEII